MVVNVNVAKNYDYVNKSISLVVKKYKVDTQVNTIREKLIVSKPAVRGRIAGLSVKSIRRLRLVLRNVTGFKNIITLTYPDIVFDITESKKHINAFLQKLRREKIRYIWVMEFQSRGAVHYHIVVDKYIDYKVVNDTWKKIIKYNCYVRTEVKSIKKSVEQYLSNYMRKLKQKNVPDFVTNVGRFWGTSRNILVLYGSYIINNVPLKKAFKSLRILIKWYQAKLKSFGINWKRKNQGFIAWGGSNVFNNYNFMEVLKC